MTESTILRVPDRFLIEGVLGRGGTAVVYRAHDRHLDRRVALKVLTPESSAALVTERFTQEIRVTANLVHPNIVPLFDSGEFEGLRFYVMPLVEGETLRQRITRQGPMAVDDALEVTTDVLEALAYAHGQGVVHRDLKPENIFLSRGRALLADFGIAKLGGVADQRLTATGMVVGTASYMSPEQANGASDVDLRTDLYAVGCLIFEMLSGAPPFIGQSAMAVVAQHLTAEPPSLVIGAGPRRTPLSSLVKRLLSKEAAARPGSAAEVLEALRGLRTMMPDGRASGALKGITEEFPVTATRRRPRNPEVVALVEQGRSAFYKAMPGFEGWRTSVDLGVSYFERALEIEPGDPNALAGLADCIQLLGYRGVGSAEEALRRARAMRVEALRRDDGDGELHASIGFTQLFWEDDFEGASLELRRAAALSPESAHCVRCFAVFLKIADRLDESVEAFRKACALDPTLAVPQNGLGDALMAAGRYEEALGPLRTALRLNPRMDAALERLELCCHRTGRDEEARAARRSLCGMRGETARLAALDAALATMPWAEARRRDVQRSLDVLLNRAESENPFADHLTSRTLGDRIIIGYTELGEWSRAMDWVERCYLVRPGRLRRVLTDLPFDRRGLAADPRYAPLLRTSGLEALL